MSEEKKISLDSVQPPSYTPEEEAIIRLHRRAKRAVFGTVKIKYRNGEAKVGYVTESMKFGK